jgi:signal transduction histidine kinase
VGQTIAMLSHHIKNILQGIRGGSYVVELGLEQHDEANIRKGWSMVDRNLNKISTMVLDMLTFSKEREPDPVPSDVNKVVGEVVELVAAKAGEQKVSVEWLPGENIPILAFDPEGIHRAVLNIAGNAVDACEDREGGIVTVRTEHLPAESLVRITVEDNGVGIPPEDLDRIFTIFVSGKGSRGTGLGLSVSRKILQEHGGNISVSSTVGQGSRFSLEFPAVVPGAPAEAGMTAEHSLTEFESFADDDSNHIARS